MILYIVLLFIATTQLIGVILAKNIPMMVLQGFVFILAVSVFLLTIKK
jgi:hypothetical protein